MTERTPTPAINFQPLIIADADTGHGGDAHVRNLIRRFVEVGVAGYHIEDQKPGAKKCGHQGGKVLVPSDEQLKRLNAARFQLDVMGVPGLVVARTDAEAANLLDGSWRRARSAVHPWRDQPRRPVLPGRVPGGDAAPQRRRRGRDQRAPPIRRAGRRGVCRRRVAGAGPACWRPSRRRRGRTRRAPRKRRSIAPPMPSWRPGRQPPACRR